MNKNYRNICVYVNNSWVLQSISNSSLLSTHLNLELFRDRHTSIYASIQDRCKHIDIKISALFLLKLFENVSRDCGQGVKLFLNLTDFPHSISHYREMANFIYITVHIILCVYVLHTCILHTHTYMFMYRSSPCHIYIYTHVRKCTESICTLLAARFNREQRKGQRHSSSVSSSQVPDSWRSEGGVRQLTQEKISGIENKLSLEGDNLGFWFLVYIFYVFQ